MRLPRDVGHAVVEAAVRLTRIEEGEQVGVLELAGQPDLAEEALLSHDRGDLGPEHLEGDHPALSQIPREENHSCTAAAKLAHDAVAVGQRGVQAVQ